MPLIGTMRSVTVISGCRWWLLPYLFLNDKALTVSANDLRDKALWIAQTDQPIQQVVEDFAAWAEKNTVTIAEWYAAHPEA